MVSESFMLQNLSVIESQKAQLDVLFRRSDDANSCRGQDPDLRNCPATPLVKAVSFCCVVDELLFEPEDPCPSDDDSHAFQYEDNERLDWSTESDSSDDDEKEDDLPRGGEDPQVKHAQRWSPDFIARAPSLSLSPVARLMEAACAKHSGQSPHSAPFGRADAR